MSNLRYQLRKLLDILKWIKSMLRLPVRLFAWILLFIFGKDNRPPNLPRDDYDEGGLLELQRPERKAQRVVEAWIMVDEEDRRHDTNNSPFPLTRAERIFLDRIDTDDEEEIVGACHCLNAEISTCTHCDSVYC